MATVNKIRYRSQSAGTVSRVKNYIEREDKTFCEELGRKLVTGLNCSPDFADREFIAARESHRKESKTWFHHYTQSFSPKEKVTPEEAHRIAVEFAERAWPEHEVVIATHLDAEHLHSHFLINAVSFKTGKLLHEGPNNIRQLRNLSDEICLEHGLSVLKNTQKQNVGISAREYRSAEKGESWKFRLMSTIDECMRYAGTKSEFIALMRSEGYDVKWTDERKSITYTTPNGKKCRDIKLHEEKYLKENMDYEFEYRRVESAQSHGRVDGAFGSTGGYGNRKELEGAAEFGKSSVGAAGGYGRTASRADDQRGRRGFADGDRRGLAGAVISASFGDRGIRKTGWEYERELFEKHKFAGAEVREFNLSGAAFSGGGNLSHRQSSASMGCGKLNSIAHAALSVLRLADDFSRFTSDRPVSPAPMHIDRKRWRELLRKRLAMGHKIDDHEEKRMEMKGF